MGRPSPADLQEFNFHKALAMLDDAPDARLAVVTEDSGNVIIATIAIRGLAVFEMDIPREKYDGFAMLELIDKHSGSDK